MKPPNKKNINKITDANINSASKNATSVPPIAFMAGDEDFDLSLNDGLDIDELSTLDEDEDDY
ncbi:MAG: hypothetical protein NT021_00095 [Sphingobacteriales bacterium]|jgi:hypothetical protein|nr:hypothetical protein [Sphingobacteriales bacterium]